METARSAIPISDQELDALRGVAERHISHINENTDLEALLRSLAPEETYRTLPIELDLVYTIRHAVCLYTWMGRYLFQHTGQEDEAKQSDLPTESIRKKQRFSSSYALFVMATAIVVDCEDLLKGKDIEKLATVKPSYKYDVGRSFSGDLQMMLSYYAETLKSDNGNGISLARNATDVVALTRDFWKSVAERALDDAQKADPAIQAVVANATFKNDDFTITGFTLEHENHKQVASFTPIYPDEIVGNTAAVQSLIRLADRLALYDPTKKINPLCEFGGLYESILLDGKPGTGKTSLIRMLVTLLSQRAEQMGLDYTFNNLDASQVKSEWFGRSAKLLSDIIKSIVDPARIAILVLDDIDLLLSPRDEPGSGSADRDLLKGLMDFLSGVGTAYKGNYCTIGATNKPTGTDDALRQRFIYRVEVTGAETWQDYADLVALQLKHPAKFGLLDIKDFGYAPLKRKREAQVNGLSTSCATSGTWQSIGQFIFELHRKGEWFTARSVKNACDVVLATASNFDIPEPWFDNPNEFRNKSWDTKIDMIKSLFNKITCDGILKALEEQFTSEDRYEKRQYLKNSKQ